MNLSLNNDKKIYVKYKTQKNPLNLSSDSGPYYAANLTWESAWKYEDFFYNIKPEFNFESKRRSFLYKQKEHWSIFYNPAQLPSLGRRGMAQGNTMSYYLEPALLADD